MVTHIRQTRCTKLWHVTRTVIITNGWSKDTSKNLLQHAQKIFSNCCFFCDAMSYTVFDKSRHSCTVKPKLVAKFDNELVLVSKF